MNRTAIYPSLKGRRVYITGGASGIGASMVRAFAGQGARVAFLDIDAATGQALADELGPKVRYDQVDVTDIAAMQATISAVDSAWEGIDVLINNAANDSRHHWSDLSPEMWDSNHAVNLRPMMFAIQTVLPGMIERQKGSIVNFGSIAWKVKHDGMPAYSVAKAAVHGLTRSLTPELGSAGVRINTLLPGWVLTQRQRDLYYDEAGKAMLLQNQPLKGIIEPEDIAGLVLFLAADDSRMCTGQEFTMDGGWA